MAGDLIKVEVDGKGPVKEYVTRKEVLVPIGATMSRLVSILRIPDGLRVICMRDGKRMPPAVQLRDGDSIIIVSMIAGG
jgi:sulfur carrier protein ThiS